MIKTYVSIVFTFLISISNLLAQDFPVYSTLSNNLYSINPSLAGENGMGTLYITYHQQVIGNLNDAPYNGLINLSSPIGKTRSSLGFNAQTFKRSLLNTNNFNLTFSHRVDLGQDHNLRLGLSGGLLNYSVDTDKLTEQEISDPALAYKLNNKTIADGQFGANYQLKNFQFGASFPKLFTFYYIDQNKNQSTKNLYPLRNFLLTTLYNFNFSQDFAFKPLIIYRKLEYENSNGNLEFDGTITYQKIGWVGISYRQKYGTAFMAGIKIKNFLSFGYTYKIINSQVKNYNNAAHEIQLGIFFGKKSKSSPLTLSGEKKPMEKMEAIPPVASKNIKTEESKVPDKINESLKPLAPRRETIKERKSADPLEMGQGNYVVTGAFKIKKNAVNYTQQLKEIGYLSKMGFNSSTQIYYVFIFKSNEINQATKEMETFKNLQGFENTWILTVTK